MLTLSAELTNTIIKSMNSVKTAVIISIIAIVMLGAVLYALRDNFKSKETTTAVVKE